MSDPSERQGDNKLAMVEVAVAPHASAGLSAFLGAGFDLGPFNATLGIEGSLSLAQLSAPIFGGAGVTMDVLEDRRLAPPDIKSPVSVLANAAGAGAIKELLAFRVPTAAKLGVYYKFGAGLHLENILKGQLDSRLRIKFLFFSKTWRKQILKFNGWSLPFRLRVGRIAASRHHWFDGHRSGNSPGAAGRRRRNHRHRWSARPWA